MKALLTLFLFALVTLPMKGQAAADIRMDDSTYNEIKSSIINIIKGSLEDDADIAPTKEGLEEEFFDLMYGLYLEGYISTSDFEQLKIDYRALAEVPPPEGGWMDKLIQEQKLIEHYRNFFETRLNQYKSHPQKCTEYLGIVNHGQCCQGLIPGPHTNYQYVSNSCKKDSMSCSKHSDCCNGVCEGLEGSENGTGYCAATKTCFQEVALNAECGVNNPFCKDRESGVACIKVEGSIALAAVGESCNVNSDCQTDKCANKKCVESMKCLKCVHAGKKAGANEKCCPGFYKGMEGTCIQDWPPFILPETTEVKRPSLLKVLISKLLLIESVYANDSVNPSKMCTYPCNQLTHLPKDQQKTIEDAQKNCVAEKSDKADLKECLDEIHGVEEAFYAGHKASNTISDPEKEQEPIQSYRDYTNEYNVPMVTAKGLSDVKSCRFNSLKDDWNDASNLEKNAEVTLRAFEYVYSGKGADFWKEGNPGKSIFDRMHEISNSLRHTRYKYIEDLRKNDTEMACLCIATFGGVSQFPDRAEFFSQNCSDESAVAALGVQDNGGNDVSGQDGAASNEDQKNNVENLNQGAIGLSHEKLLVEWLTKRSSIQFTRFIDNYEMEVEMQKVIEYLRTEPWLKGNVTKEDKTLYRYAVKWTAGWVVWLGMILTGFLYAPALLLTAIVGGGGLWWNSGIHGLTALGTTMALMGNVDPSRVPTVKDVKIKDKKCWNLLCTAKYNGYNRLFLHSYSEACQMNGPSTMCLKNAYISPETDTSKKETYYLIDIQNPLFVPPTKYVYETNFTSLVNTSFNKALNLLRLTKPDKHKCKSTAGCWDYARRTEKYEERNILLEYTYNGNNVKYRQFGPGYKPLIHAFAPEYNLRKFDTSYKDAFINGVKTYSRCYALKDCAAATGTQAFGLTENDIGFKLFFSDGVTEEINEAELNAFAEYVYQLHFLWPNTSIKNTLSYPLPGMIPYFEAILYNIKLLGSLQAERAEKYFETAIAYGDDFEQRFKDYKMAAGTMGLGEKSKNAKFGKKFFAKFKALDLKGGGGNIASYENMLDEAVKSGEFNSAELAALKAGTSKAIRAANDKKRYAHYQETVGKTERGKKAIDKAKDFMQKFNSPIESFPSVAGSRFSSGGTDTNMLSSSEQKETTSSAKQEIAAYTPPSFPSVDNYGMGVGSSNYGSSSSTSSGDRDQLNNDVSNAEAEHMIMSSEKDKSLYEDDPNDTIFIKVSKAYKRNLDRMLVRKNDLAVNANTEEVEKSSHSSISDEQKESLKNLLEKN